MYKFNFVGNGRTTTQHRQCYKSCRHYGAWPRPSFQSSQGHCLNQWSCSPAETFPPWIQLCFSCEFECDNWWGILLSISILIYGTCSCIQKIYSLAPYTYQVRNWIMPINRKYKLGLLLETLREELRFKNNYKVLFEYVMLSGVNDRLDKPICFSTLFDLDILFISCFQLSCNAVAPLYFIHYKNICGSSALDLT